MTAIENSALCTATLTWTPYDAERGFDLPTRTDSCRLPAGHSGYHNGRGGVFGPIVEPDDGNAIAPWDDGRGCFGHCDPEGWFRPCRTSDVSGSDRGSPVRALPPEPRERHWLPGG